MAIDLKYNETIQAQFQELNTKYPNLNLVRNDSNNYYTISGILGFSSEFEGIRIKDAFELYIMIPNNYPQQLPTVKEIGGRIPMDFHRYNDETLCLGSPAENWFKFNKCKTLINFIENLAIPYLFSFSFWKKTGRMPFGQRSHEGKGILEFYRDFFKVKDLQVAKKFLKLLASESYSRNKQCPCESGKRIRKCHGGKILDIIKTVPLKVFQYEYTISKNV